MNEKLIFKWNGENDKKSVGKCIWKSRYVKIKYHYLLSSTKI